MEARLRTEKAAVKTEVARIEAAYTARDAATTSSPYQFSKPGYAFYVQLLEWSVLEGIRRSPVDIEGARVLDVGCGTGYLVHRLVEFGAAEASGVDLMPARIEEARRRYPQVRFIAANAAKLPFGDGEFDIVTQFTCLSSVLDPSLRGSIASEMWRVLRPGGVVLSYDIRAPTWPVRTMRRLGAWRRTRADQSDSEVATPIRDLSAAHLRRLFPDGSLDYASVGLAFGLCGIAAHSYLAARLLARIALLREHGIGVVLKEPQNRHAE
jgi:SAM-dependent methyltransferase